ncbi:MotE family protein [Pseudooceanicola sp. MF1-13]|uniref:MotE family protein n=1 Tax=Pseudooceanicola sp. MF1-13 TaxID=3379095 RepID=UPI0038912FAF
MFGLKRKPRKKRSRTRGTLFIISCLLIGSALLRIGDDAGRALAKVGESDRSDLVTDASPQACEPEPDVAAMLEAFKQREDRVALREQQVADRMRALQIADTEVTRKLGQLQEAEEALRATLALADTAAEDDLSRLTAVYQNMKPKDAAILFEEMDPQFAAGFLGRMDPAVAAGIMAGLSPQAAYTISVILAGRNANVPTE